MKEKLKSYNFWVSVTSAVILILRIIGGRFGLVISEDTFMDIMVGLCSIFVIFGLISSPKNRTIISSTSDGNITVLDWLKNLLDISDNMKSDVKNQLDNSSLSDCEPLIKNDCIDNINFIKREDSNLQTVDENGNVYINGLHVGNVDDKVNGIPCVDAYRCINSENVDVVEIVGDGKIKNDVESIVECLPENFVDSVAVGSDENIVEVVGERETVAQTADDSLVDNVIESVSGDLVGTVVQSVGGDLVGTEIESVDCDLENVVESVIECSGETVAQSVGEGLDKNIVELVGERETVAQTADDSLVDNVIESVSGDLVGTVVQSVGGHSVDTVAQSVGGDLVGTEIESFDCDLENVVESVSVDLETAVESVIESSGETVAQSVGESSIDNVVESDSPLPSDLTGFIDEPVDHISIFDNP